MVLFLYDFEYIERDFQICISVPLKAIKLIFLPNFDKSAIKNNPLMQLHTIFHKPAK